MPDVSLFVIPDAFLGEPRPALEPDAPPYFIGEGDVNLLCGECSFVLAKNLMTANQLVGQPRLRCPGCGAMNEHRM